MKKADNKNNVQSEGQLGPASTSNSLEEFETKSNARRREFLKQSLVATGSLGLRSLLLGLPPTFLTERAMAAAAPSFLVMCTSDRGHPVNPNAPGSYVAGVMHPAGFTTPVATTLGITSTMAAAPWANLPAALRNRMQVIHHATRSPSHSDLAKVMHVQGALKTASGNGQEMLPSAIAELNKVGLGALNSKPLILGSPGSTITANGAALPITPASSIGTMFAGAANATTRQLAAFRNATLDTLYKDLKANGTSAQKKFLDDHAMSSQQAQDLGVKFQNTLANLGQGNSQDQLTGAAALIAAKVSATMIISLPFGGDNHSGGASEVNDTTSSLAAIGAFWDQLVSLGIQDQTTFFLQEVFGRTLKRTDRDHNGSHNVGVLFGPNVKGGITGGIDNNLRASAINSIDGSTNGADVPFNETLASVAKTVMSAVGIAETDINKRVLSGKILRSAVNQV